MRDFATVYERLCELPGKASFHIISLLPSLILFALCGEIDVVTSTVKYQEGHHLLLSIDPVSQAFGYQDFGSEPRQRRCFSYICIDSTTLLLHT